MKKVLGFLALGLALALLVGQAVAQVGAGPDYTVAVTVADPVIEAVGTTSLESGVMVRGGRGMRVPVTLRNPSASPVSFTFLSVTPSGVGCALSESVYDFTLVAGGQQTFVFDCAAAREATAGSYTIEIRVMEAATDPQPGP